MLTPAETEFIAEKQLITIVPNFTHGRIFLICGDIGPFTASIPVSVPFWLAINLKQRQKCRIIPPDWMDVAKLEEKKQEESESAVFTKPPSPHFVEITHMLLSYASVDVPHAEDIRTVVKDIWDLRMAKLRNSIEAFVKSDSTHAKLDHLTIMEINTIRQFLIKSLNHLQTLRQNFGKQIDDSQDTSNNS